MTNLVDSHAGYLFDTWDQITDGPNPLEIIQHGYCDNNYKYDAAEVGNMQLLDKQIRNHICNSDDLLLVLKPGVKGSKSQIEIHNVHIPELCHIKGNFTSIAWSFEKDHPTTENIPCCIHLAYTKKTYPRPFNVTDEVWMMVQGGQKNHPRKV